MSPTTIIEHVPTGAGSLPQGTREDSASQPNAKFNLVVGGSVGDDPYDSHTWSGSAMHLAAALQQSGVLNQALGLRLPRWQDAALKLKNFSSSREIWRQKFYLDTAYRVALTQSAGRMSVISEPGSAFLQIGAMYSLPQATGHRVPCFSYHDGNIAEALKSGYGFQGIPSTRIDEAIRYERDIAQEMTSVFTFSEYLRKSFIAEFGVDERRVVSVGGGVNIEEVPPAYEDKNYDRREILFVGVDFGRKGGPELLSAIRIVRETFPDARLHIVGPHQLPSGANEPGIVFHGNLNKSIPAQRDQLYRLYRESSVFVLPSKYEPFGVAPLEAMLFQLPCIVTDGWALREFVTPNVNGALVEKGSVDSLAVAITGLLKSPEQLAVMGRRGRDLVLDNYLWPKVVGRIKAAAKLN